MKKTFLFLLFCIPFIGLAHGVPEATIKAMANASTLDYIYFGATHMITGYDHILFLIGIVFFLSNYMDIFKFITAFTIAHCITLIFATFYGITANAYLVDAVIAFSVIYKGFENLDGFKKYFSTRAPNLVLMVFIFGLIHGLGLATKIQDMTLSDDGLVTNILSFNLGVEIGQMIALLGALVAINLWRTQGGFYKHARMFNYCLMFSGFMLASFQISGYFLSFALL